FDGATTFALPIEINGVTYNAALVQLSTSPGMIDGDFAPGTFGFEVMSHEVGHVLGLSHPHDDGLDSSASVPGTAPGAYQYGDFALNQGIYTQMSYLSGFAEKDGHPTVDEFVSIFRPYSTQYGSPQTPMAVDIAGVQQLYGANTTTATG